MQQLLVQDATKSVPPPLLLHVEQGEEAAPPAPQVEGTAGPDKGHTHQRAT